MSEVGHGINKFESAKQFASWLRLAPNNKISGGKILSNRIPKGSNRLKIALRNAANAVGNLKDTALSNFFKRIAFPKRKNISHLRNCPKASRYYLEHDGDQKVPYKSDTEYEFLDQKRKRKVMEMKKLIHKFDITTDDLGLQLNINNL
jgi:transposase